MKFNFYTDANKNTICTCKYHGKTIKGVAHYDSRDKFDAAFGRELALAKCKVKLTRKQYEYNLMKLTDITQDLNDAMIAHEEMRNQFMAATRNAKEAEEVLMNIISKGGK